MVLAFILIALPLVLALTAWAFWPEISTSKGERDHA